MAGRHPRAISTSWFNWLTVKIGRLAASDKWRRDLARMTERDLKDIGLIHSDIHRISREMPPPTDRPPR